MTEPFPAAQAFVAGLPDDLLAEVEDHIAQCKIALAMIALRERGEPAPGPRMITEVLDVLAQRMHVGLACFMCGAASAKARDDYPFEPLCDGCSLKYTSWPCPDCGKQCGGGREHAGEPCSACEIERMWQALAQDVRDEIDTAVAEMSTIPALMRIRELVGDWSLREARVIHHARDQNRRSS